MAEPGEDPAARDHATPSPEDERTPSSPHPLAPGPRPPAPASAASAPPAPALPAARFHALGRRLWLAGTALDLLLPAGFWAAGASAWLAGQVARAGPRPAQVAVYALVAGLGYALLSAPITILRGYRLPRRFGLLTQGFGSWLADLLKGGALGGALGLLALEFLYWSVAAAPRWWWLLDGLAALALSLLLGLAAPVLIAPLFFRFTPLRRPEVLGRITALLARSGMPARGVYEFDLSRKLAAANAAVFGFGPTRRIVLADSLLDRYSPAEIEAVVAHELGHHAHRDLWIGAAAGGIVTLLALLAVALTFSPAALGGRWPLADLANLPLWLLVFEAASLLLSPLALAASRCSERRADAYARRLASEPAALGSALARLGAESLADPAPPRWEVLLRYSHPPLYERTGDEGTVG